jgi:hypothetical protein
MTQVPNQQENLIYFFMLYSGLVISQSRSLQNIEHDLRPLARNIGHQVVHLLALAHKSVSTPSYVQISRGGNVVEWKSIASGTKLQEAGDKFKNAERGGILFDIKFNSGVMKIPLLKVGDRSESFFQNLIAYEQYSRNDHCNHKYVTDYVRFMDYLINSPKDVELLRRQGIIENLLGDDEAISTMFNKLGDFVIISNFYYAEICRDVNKHCRKRWNP